MLLCIIPCTLFADVKLFSSRYEVQSSGIQMKTSSNGKNEYLTFTDKYNNICKYKVVETYYRIGSVITTYTMIAESLSGNCLLGNEIKVSFFKSQMSDSDTAPQAVTVDYDAGSLRMYSKSNSNIKIDFPPETASSRKSWDHTSKVLNPRVVELGRQLEKAQNNRNYESNNANRNKYSTIRGGGKASASGSVSSSHGIDIKAAVEVRGQIMISIH